MKNNGKNAYLLRKYGITLADWNIIYERQQKKCAICLGDKPLVVDHLHGAFGPKSIRGLLCSGCNLSCGHFKDNPNRMERAVVYLKRHWGKYYDEVEKADAALDAEIY